MNCKKLLLATSFVVLTYASVSAQKKEGNNIVKVNLSTFLIKGIGLQYERQVGKRTTVALGISLIPTSTVPFKSQLEKTIDNPRVNVDQFKFGNTVITPELRYYFGTKGAFHGFYLAPYVRLGNYHVEGPVTYNSSTDTVRTALFNGNIFFYSAGLMMGSSFKLSDKIYLDWWIIGGSIGAANGTVHADSKMNDDEQRSLKDQLEQTNLPLTSTTSEVTATGATVFAKGTMVGVRGLGINIGFRF